MQVFVKAMKKLFLLSLLLVALASLVGCTTGHHQHAVEYKLITLRGKQGPPEPELNRLASEGWRVVGFQRDSGAEDTLVLERRK